MAIATTNRLQITTWSADTDAFTREHLHDSHTNLEDRAAVFLKGTFASRPAPGVTNDRGFYLATDQSILYYSDGSTWSSVNSYGTPGAITPGDTIDAGVATTAARSDHRHSLPGYGTTTAAVSTAAAAGVATTFSRSDHVHTLDNNSVTAGKIAAGGVSAANQLANDVVTTSAILDSNVTRAKIEPAERIPTGTILPYVGLTAPTGWMMCEGGEVLASSALGTMLSTRYNTGGETPGYVRVPDLRSRFPLGAASSGSWSGSAYGGADTVTLTSNNLPTHTHASGTLANDTVAAHSHGVTGITVGNRNLSHTHGIGHSHNVGGDDGSNVDVLAMTTAGANYTPYLSAFVSITTSGRGNLIIGTSGNDTGNAHYSFGKQNSDGGWTTYTQSTSTTSSLTATNDSLTSHNHTLSGSTATDNAHSHTISGATGNNTTTGSSFSTVSAYAGISYIIKT